MLKNYLTVAIRNLWCNKTYASVSIGGLALGGVQCMHSIHPACIWTAQWQGRSTASAPGTTPFG